MVERLALRAFGVCLLGTTVGWGQALPTSATIESVPLEPTMPDRYQVTAALEPVRRVSIVAPADGLIRSLETPVGMTVRANQEIAQMDRAELAARLKAALADVKEKQALLRRDPSSAEIYRAQLEAAQARAELAQIALDRLTLRAPFPGRIVEVPVSAGQYVLKGTVLAELADVTSFKALVPVDRRSATEGGELRVFVEEQEQAARVQSVLPLPDAYRALKDLAAPFAGAWITVPNTRSELAAGMRVRSETLPITPIASVPRDAVKAADAAGASSSTIQVIRSEYVTDVSVKVLGQLGADRLQVTGPFRATDSLIVSSSVPLLPGTLVRFSQGAPRAVEGTTPNPDRRGDDAGIVPPPGAGAGAAPAGSRPRTAAPPATRSPRRQMPAQGKGSTPF